MSGQAVPATDDACAIFLTATATVPATGAGAG